jgi:predicted nucleic acid-binding protein
MKFWDSSAVAALLLADSAGATCERELRADAAIIVWWGTAIEVCSAVARREREGRLSSRAVIEVLDRLDTLAARWSEVQPTDRLRAVAQRVLRVHPLRAADALQLAAALLASDEEPAGLDIVTLDSRLADAARREGFRVSGT